MKFYLFISILGMVTYAVLPINNIWDQERLFGVILSSLFLAFSLSPEDTAEWQKGFVKLR